MRVIECYLEAPRHVVIPVSDADHLKKIVATEKPTTILGIASNRFTVVRARWLERDTEDDGDDRDDRQAP